MKVLSIILMILGVLLFFVGLAFNLFNWPDMFNGLLSGPILLTIGILYTLFQKRIIKNSIALTRKKNQKRQPLIFKAFFIFTACICTVVLILGAFVLHNFKNSEPFLIAKQTAFQNHEIQEITGKIIGTGFMVGGEITQDSASLNFNIIGEKKDLRVDCNLKKQTSGTWKVLNLTYD